jgi:hypothetical protein
MVDGRRTDGVCLLQEQAEALVSSFEAPLKEFVRLVKSAKAVMADRSSALQAAHQVSPLSRHAVGVGSQPVMPKRFGI